MYIAREEHKFQVDDYGFLQIVGMSTPPTQDGYCYERVVNHSAAGEKVFLCMRRKNPVKFNIIKIIVVISCVFLVITITGYFTLPNLLNLFGKTLMCYCFCLLFGMVSLAASNFVTKYGTNLCVTLGKR